MNQPGHGAPQSSAASSLHDEHALLQREVRKRVEPVLREADAGRWPQQELVGLVNYLQQEVLRQIADEEWLLFRVIHEPNDDIARLRRDHLELRLTVDTLTQAVAGRGLTAGQLARVVRDLLDQLDAHLSAEEGTLGAAEAAAPSMASLGSQPHEWYELTEGSIIELRQLPGRAGAEAAFDRLLRMRPTERVELHSGTDPSPLWRKLLRSDPGGWGVSTLEAGPPRWRVEIIRRPPEPPLSPSAG